MTQAKSQRLTATTPTRQRHGGALREDRRTRLPPGIDARKQSQRKFNGGSRELSVAFLPSKK
jgi:hypothetical protein